MRTCYSSWGPLAQASGWISFGTGQFCRAIVKQLIEEDERGGVTSNLAIFEKAISDGHDEDADMRSMAFEGKRPSNLASTMLWRPGRSHRRPFEGE
jgi:hypothetical protein